MLSRGIQYTNVNVLWLFALCGSIIVVALLATACFQWCIEDGIDDKMKREEDKDEDEEEDERLPPTRAEIPLIRRQPKRNAKHSIDYSNMENL